MLCLLSVQVFRDPAQVLHEPLGLGVPSGVVGGAEDRRRVDGRQRRRHEVGGNSPRRCVTLKLFPRSAWAAVAPRQTTTFGLTTAISLSSHGRQAAISAALGLARIRRLPRGSHLKCFTTLVT